MFVPFDDNKTDEKCSFYGNYATKRNNFYMFNFAPLK